jgi:hypothetical protein
LFVRAALLALILGLVTPTYAAEPASCAIGLAGSPLLARLQFTGWTSRYGTYGLLRITGVRQAKLEDRIYYVFDGKDGPTQIFRQEGIEEGRRSYRLGHGGTVSQYFSKLRLVEVDANGEAIAGQSVEVERMREHDGFLVEEWKFARNDVPQSLAFYDLVAEKQRIEARTREAERLAAIPEPGSKAGIRAQIIADLRRRGEDPAGMLWIDDEVERQWADMWRHLTR